ncbi:MAG: ribonuclease H family protein [Candidatus Amulumruptor caecigallinarius]|nr:ribonuclease H family protein [Candidatus Amulumruptor caecigallinarius]
MAIKKFYVVWVGRNPGVYDDLGDAMEQVDDYPGARFKGFDSAAEAAEAFRKGTAQSDKEDIKSLLFDAQRMNIPTSGQPDYMSIPEIDLDGWAVDAACAGNPGKMEYRGVELMSGREIFRVGPFPKSTNNIGEFLAIVHALSLMHRNGERHTIYSDSKTGMAWVRNRKVKTQLLRTPETEQSFRLMERALSWLNTHSVDVNIRKWETERWGEIPADFGRK